MSKLDARLSHALTQWRRDVEHARAGHPGLNLENVESRRCSVIVRHSGDLAALQAAGLEAGFDNHGLVAGLIRLADVERLLAVPSVELVAKEPDFRPLDVSVPEMRVPWKTPPATPWPGKGAGVIVAVIDTGIDIFHQSFRKPDGTTRILEMWDQSASAGGAAPPAGFAQVGRVYDLPAINAGLTAGAPFASVDSNGHGTHVAGIAAGNGSQDDRCDFPGKFVGVAPEADLVVVKAIDLPAGANANISDALRWCANASTRLQAVPPGRTPVPRAVVINGSFGSDTGPHDGNGLMDAWIDSQLRPGGGGAPAGLAIVIAAGNAASHEIHETGTINPGAAVTVPFYVPDGSLKPNTLDIWYTGAATLSIQLTAPPNPAVPGSVATGPVTATTTVPIGRMNIDFAFVGPAAAHGNRSNISVSIHAQPQPAGGPPLAVRPGNWQMTLTNTAGPAADWDAWFATKHGDGFPTFKMPGDPDVTLRRRLNTIDEPGTSRNAITVAAYNAKSGELADFSSRGPAAVPAGLPVGEFKPTFTAPGVGVNAPHSQTATQDDPSSCCDQKVVDMDGTSMASPHVAGLVALMFEKNKTLTFDQVRAHIQKAARIDGIPAADVPPIYDPALNIRANNLWGSGKVDAAQALADIPQATLVAGGGGGGAPLMFAASEPSAWGYTPHTFASRLRDLQMRFGPRPGVTLFAFLVSEHVDEVLHLVNHNRRVATVWRRNGGPHLVRRLLNGPPPQTTLMPPTVNGYDVTNLLTRFLPQLGRYGGDRMRADIRRFRDFAALWPSADLRELDEEALARTSP